MNVFTFPTSVDPDVAQCVLDAYLRQSDYTECELHCALHIQAMATGQVAPDTAPNPSPCKKLGAADHAKGLEMLKLLASGKKGAIFDFAALLALIGPFVLQILQSLLSGLFPTPPKPA